MPSSYRWPQEWTEADRVEDDRLTQIRVLARIVYQYQGELMLCRIHSFSAHLCIANLPHTRVEGETEDQAIEAMRKQLLVTLADALAVARDRVARLEFAFVIGTEPR